MRTKLSPKELADLIRRCGEHKAESDEYGVMELLRGDILNAYLIESPTKRLRQETLLQFFFDCGNATLAACRLDMSDRTAQQWVNVFVDFAAQKLQERHERQEAYSLAKAQCEYICDRKAQHSPSFGPEKWNANARTKQEPRGDGGGCPACPLRMMK